MAENVKQDPVPDAGKKVEPAQPSLFGQAPDDRPNVYTPQKIGRAARQMQDPMQRMTVRK